MVDCYVGEIRMFGGNYAPQGWALCDGSSLSINEYQTLYSLIGTTYGGDGVNNFKLPDLRGRIPIGQGNGTGLTPRTLSQRVGAESVALVSDTAPAHTHAVTAGAAATAADPTNQFPGIVSGATLYYKAPLPNPPPTIGILDKAALSSSGEGVPHQNIMPSLCITFIIALNGLYPDRN